MLNLIRNSQLLQFWVKLTSWLMVSRRVKCKDGKTTLMHQQEPNTWKTCDFREQKRKEQQQSSVFEEQGQKREQWKQFHHFRKTRNVFENSFDRITTTIFRFFIFSFFWILPNNSLICCDFGELQRFFRRFYLQSFSLIFHQLNV